MATAFVDGPKSPRPTFDLHLVDSFFPAVHAKAGDAHSSFLSDVLTRNSDLTPTLEEQTHITALVSQVQIILENISLDPDASQVVQMEEFRVVGSFKKGTMTRGKNEADVVLILRSPPALESVKQLAFRVSDALSKSACSTSLTVQVTDYGVCITNNGAAASVRLLLACQDVHPTPAARLHLPPNLLLKHLAAIRHVRWFEGAFLLRIISS